MNNISAKLVQLWKEERGVTAALMALLVTSLVGMSGLAVDLGVAFTAKAQVQNAADSAALAAANTMLGVDANNNPVAQPWTALATAEEFSGANQALGVNVPLKASQAGDFVIGYWDTDQNKFDPNRTGMNLTNPNDVNAVSVTVRRDSVANTPVDTYFARIVGVNQINVKATSTAFLGAPYSVPAGTVDLPIAVLSSAANSGTGPNCGDSLTFRSQGDQDAEWTTFFTWSSNTPIIDGFVTGEEQIPALTVGDQINLTNGVISNNTFDDLAARFNASQTDGQWQVTLPVIDAAGMGANAGTVVGFTTFVITSVDTAPLKQVSGFLKCGVVIPSTPTGGGNYGARASASKLIH